ncbi:hypothetical protein DFH09DRAFT_1217991 [Mycena vulgaris]|nr:hypothetical protein DFH09DRAFT_1217991 [Mycena vulgaris]
MKIRWRIESKPTQKKPRRDGGCYPPPRFRDLPRALAQLEHICGHPTSAGASGESTASETTLPSTADGGRSDTAFSLAGDATSSSTGTNAACSTDASTALSRASGAISGVMWNSESNSGAGLGLGRCATSTRSISSSRSSWDGACALLSSQGSPKRTRCEGSGCGGGVAASAPAGDGIAGGAASPSGDGRGSALVSAEGSTAAAAGRRLCPRPRPHPPRQQTTRDAHHLRPDAVR